MLILNLLCDLRDFLTLSGQGLPSQCQAGLPGRKLVPEPRLGDPLPWVQDEVAPMCGMRQGLIALPGVSACIGPPVPCSLGWVNDGDASLLEISFPLGPQGCEPRVAGGSGGRQGAPWPARGKK